MTQNADKMPDKTSARYKIIEPIGCGSFGTVYLAHDNVLNRDVAIKMMVMDKATSDEERQRLVQRFQREARAVAGLSHPNIVVIYDISKAKEKHYFSMEYLNGHPLSDIIDDPLPVDRAIHIAEQILSALQYAHENDVIHRDIKPENIFILEGDQVKLVDFGLARIQSTSTLTRTGAVLGSPGYMPPEMFQGKDIDSRTDIFSFGVVFYEMLCGRRPFGPDEDEEDNYPRVIYRSLSEDPEPPTRLCPEIPAEIERIVLICLQKDPKWRYQSAADVLGELEAYKSKAPGELDGAEWKAGSVPSGGRTQTFYVPPPAEAAAPAAAVPGAESQPRQPAAPVSKQQRRRKIIVAALAIAILAVVGVATGLFVTRRADANAPVSRIDSFTLARLDGAPLNLSAVPVGTDLVMETVVSCSSQYYKGLGELTMKVMGANAPLQVNKRQQVPPTPDPQTFAHAFRITKGGQDFVATVEIDLMLDANEYKSSSRIRFHAQEGTAEPVTFEQEKGMATEAMAEAGAAVALLKQKNITLDSLEGEYDGVSSRLAEVDSAAGANVFLDYALSVISRAKKHMPQ
jgi:hypothetical protein